MKKLFSWRFPLSEAEFSSLWESATFVFDTNFLLDLYRVSRSTSEDFLRILERLQDRIWLPYQVAEEFLNGREAVIEKEAASFDKALSTLEEWKNKQSSLNDLRSQLGQTGRIVAAEIEFLFGQQEKYLSAVEEVERAFREKIQNFAQAHATLNTEQDFILETLLSLFDDKVGEPYGEPDLQKLYREGDERYKQSKPPGFKDIKKEGNEKHGDFILWKQILDFAKAQSRPIVFVTGEKKDDWWTKNKRRDITSPHIELRREFNNYVKQPFWMYRTQEFLEIAKERLMVEIDPRSIEESNAIADADQQALEESQILDEIRQQVAQEAECLREAVAQLQSRSEIDAAHGLKLIKKSSQPKTIKELIENLSSVEELGLSVNSLIPEELLESSSKQRARDWLGNLLQPTINAELLEAYLQALSASLIETRFAQELLRTEQFNLIDQQVSQKYREKAASESSKVSEQSADAEQTLMQEDSPPVTDEQQQEVEQPTTGHKKRSSPKTIRESNKRNNGTYKE